MNIMKLLFNAVNTRVMLYRKEHIRRNSNINSFIVLITEIKE